MATAPTPLSFEVVRSWTPRVTTGSGAPARARSKAPGPLTLEEGDRRILAAWAAGCAQRVLPLYEARAPGDPRPRAALDGLRAFARGELRVGPMRTLATAAHAAARAARHPAAVAAARACGHAAATAHMASHARGVPAYASVAVAGAARESGDAASSEVDAAIGLATPEVLAILRRLPPAGPPAGALGRAIAELDSRIRSA